MYGYYGTVAVKDKQRTHFKWWQ